MRSRIISAVLLILILSPMIGNCIPHEHNGENEVSFLSGLLSSAKNLGSAPTHSVSAQTVISGMSAQSNWAWCHKCNGLFYFGPGQPPNSICPRDGGQHEAIGSANYQLPYLSNGQPTPSGYQDHWHWCKNCQAIWFDLSGAPNVCPRGGAHDSTGSGSYVLGFTSTSPNSQQDQWRWCNQCGVLHYGPLVSQSMCPATHGNHSTSGSGNYYIDFQPNQVIPVNQMELALSVENGSAGGISAGGQILGQSGIYPTPQSPLAYYSQNTGVQSVKIANAPDRGLSYMAYAKGNIIRFASAPRNQITTGNLAMTDLSASNISFSTFSSFGFVYFKGNFYLNYSSPQGGQSVYRSSDCINWTNVFAYGGSGSYNYSLSAVVTGAGSAAEKIWVSYATPLPGYGVTIRTSTDGSNWTSSYYYYNSSYATSAQLAALSNGETILAFSIGGVGVVPIQYVTSINGIFPNNTANTFPNNPSSNTFREIDIVSTGTNADVFLTFIDSGSTSNAYLKRYNLQNGTELQSATYSAPAGGVLQKPSVNLIPVF
ncbi:hypothetical protein [Leptospira saintgironsiae]|uniref:Uncharacterized protein n=1 Tax=Leptospira saintgironsiae TaxID=2023183 RepID=A0A2M9YHQ1_9LEPT|nr:hypothetical protein [Leptospira saintgironsiae]PJZ51024.1 hypothetical protein CH362_04520 [Leptospira saintgironsiae]